MSAEKIEVNQLKENAIFLIGITLIITFSFILLPFSILTGMGPEFIGPLFLCAIILGAIIGVLYYIL
jgi:hypothetical protein